MHRACASASVSSASSIDHVPFGVELLLGDRVGELGPLRELARERLRFGQHILDDAVVEAPGESFVAGHARGR